MTVTDRERGGRRWARDSPRQCSGPRSSRPMTSLVASAAGSPGHGTVVALPVLEAASAAGSADHAHGPRLPVLGPRPRRAPSWSFLDAVTAEGRERGGRTPPLPSP